MSTCFYTHPEKDLFTVKQKRLTKNQMKPNHIPVKETYKRDLLYIKRKSIKRGIQKRPEKETYKRDVQKRPTNETN